MHFFINFKAIRALFCIAFALAFPGCQQIDNISPGQELKSNQKPVKIVQAIAKAAQACWYKSKDPAFSGTLLAEESNSYAGRPRILIVPKKNPTGLPLLVVQAERKGNKSSGQFTQVEIFGAMMTGTNKQRIDQDVKRWIAGDNACRST